MVVLITGCRSGFGLRAALEAGRRGHTVYAGLRDVLTADALIDAAAELDIRPVQLDVTQAEERTQVVEQILHDHGRIDALVNNAGVMLSGFLEDVDEDELRNQFEVNVFGAFALTNAVLPTMRAQRRGAIVMVSSMSGRMAVPGLASYAASKFALEGMTEGYWHELKPFGIRVHLVEPGPYQTDLLGRNDRRSRRTTAESPYADAFAAMQALKARLRPGDPEEVAQQIVELAEYKGRRLRYPMGNSARLRSALLGVAPERLWSTVMQRMMR